MWQGKDLQDGIFVCVAGKGVTGAFLACVAGKGVREPLNAEAQRTQRLQQGADPTPRVFCQKSVDLLDCKGVEFCGDDQEFATV